MVEQKNWYNLLNWKVTQVLIFLIDNWCIYIVHKLKKLIILLLPTSNKGKNASQKDSKNGFQSFRAEKKRGKRCFVVHRMFSPPCFYMQTLFLKKENKRKKEDDKIPTIRNQNTHYFLFLGYSNKKFVYVAMLHTVIQRTNPSFEISHSETYRKKEKKILTRCAEEGDLKISLNFLKCKIFGFHLNKVILF